jgi:hypothetical protein
MIYLLLAIAIVVVPLLILVWSLCRISAMSENATQNMLDK